MTRGRSQNDDLWDGINVMRSVANPHRQRSKNQKSRCVPSISLQKKTASILCNQQVVMIVLPEMENMRTRVIKYSLRLVAKTYGDYKDSVMANPTKLKLRAVTKNTRVNSKYNG